MESMLFLGNVASFPILVSNTSTVSSLQKTKLHFSFSNHTSPSLTSRNTCHPGRKLLNPTIRALDGSSSVPSGNDRKANKIAKNTARASIALACVLGIIGASLKMNPEAIAGPREKFQKAPQIVSNSPAYPLGGRYALKSLLDVNVYLASTKIEPPGPPSRLPARPSMENVYDIKGKYKEALQYCNRFTGEQVLPSDGRIPLYKVLSFMLLLYSLLAPYNTASRANFLYGRFVTSSWGQWVSYMANILLSDFLAQSVSI
ncbi:uncharacterized protein LOC8264114 isoform X3 [Ricinus communis]|uniref:uncharacterized protein LOC8264114 isoform X3 n=1 Tax=Ricinus communis TaxID=3988 RepID=UPI00201B2A94|nr:uncharacterized protein LOC8264114 isoform X3 [Ricinus communis]